MKKNFKKVILPAVTAVGLAFALTACGGSKNNDTTAAEDTVEIVSETTAQETTTQSAKKTIGKEEAGSISFEFTNKTGKDITEVSYNAADSATKGANLLESGDKFANDETRTVYFKLEDASEEVNAENESSEEAVSDADVLENETTDAQDGEENAETTVNENNFTTEYEVNITLDGNEKHTLHAFPVKKIKEGSVKIEDGVAYIEYKSVDSEQTISTLNAEKAISARGDVTTQNESQAEGNVTMATAEQGTVLNGETQAATQQPVAEQPAVEQEQPVEEQPVVDQIPEDQQYDEQPMYGDDPEAGEYYYEGDYPEDQQYDEQPMYGDDVEAGEYVEENQDAAWE